jgi:flagellar biosynthesis chaperone FliJ
MNEKDLYQQKLKAQLNEWQADIDKLKAKMAGASVGAKLELNQHINMLEGKIDEGNSKLDELDKATDDSWETLEDGFEEAWESISAAFKDAYKKFL